MVPRRLSLLDASPAPCQLRGPREEARNPTSRNIGLFWSYIKLSVPRNPSVYKTGSVGSLWMCFEGCGIQLKNKDLLSYINQPKVIRRVLASCGRTRVFRGSDRISGRRAGRQFLCIAPQPGALKYFFATDSIGDKRPKTTSGYCSYAAVQVRESGWPQS